MVLRYRPSEVYVSMINAFKQDCQSLIKRFQDKQSDSFSDFVPFWKSLKFNLIYEKYNKCGLNNDFKQDTLQIAKYIMLNDHFVGGMYLLYGLYYVQEDPKPTIRMEHQELEKLLGLLMDERKSLMETCQPGFMFAKLLKNNAFDFVMFSRDYCMESQSRSRLVHDGHLISSQVKNSVNAAKWFKGFVQRLDIVDDLKKVELGYFEKKKKLKEENPELNLALDMVPDDIITGIEESLSQEKYVVPGPLNIGERRTQLKHKRRKIKHRYGEPSTSQSQCKIKRPRGAPKGMRNLYFKVMINEPASEDDFYEYDDDEGPKQDLPDLL